MDKNWLIRTKSNHILGPVSKEKVLELYNNGSIKGDDEVCSGNGYWFFIREKDLVDRFLMGSEIQSFNPISEAKDVLTSKGEHAGQAEEDITMVGGINLSMLNKQSGNNLPPMPESSDDTAAMTSSTKGASPAETKKKTKITPRLKSHSGSRVVKTPKKQEWIKYVGLFIFVMLVLMIYKRQKIMDFIFGDEVSFISLSLINEAVAQEEIPEKKKSY